MRKIIFWTLGMAFVGAFFGSLDSYSLTWYGVLLDSRIEILIGASIGAILGYAFLAAAANHFKVAHYPLLLRLGSGRQSSVFRGNGGPP